MRRDHAKAVKWFRKSADQGYVWARHNLGRMYFSGKGVSQDYAEAVKWFRMAAGQNQAGAQYFLGTMYRDDLGVMRDDVESYKWLARSAAQGNEDARKSREVVAKRMTPAQIAKAQKLTRGWKPAK